MQIKIEEFTAKQIINFYPQQNIAPEGTFVAAVDNPNTNSLASRLLKIDGIERCMITPSVISVKYSGNTTDDIRLSVMAEIDDFCAEQSTEIAEDNKLSAAEQAEAIADAFIRPTLYSDNGDIVIHNITDGVLELSFSGHCAGCPYAQNTLQNIVARAFKKYMPQIKDVHLREA
ncbi:MAG: NifU family protein [Alphaproteobacteria bacterium]|nr:NifU family protein [Alphaproteobacteria bacterium]